MCMHTQRNGHVAGMYSVYLVAVTRVRGRRVVGVVAAHTQDTRRSGVWVHATRGGRGGCLGRFGRLRACTYHEHVNSMDDTHARVHICLRVMHTCMLHACARCCPCSQMHADAHAHVA